MTTTVQHRGTVGESLRDVSPLQFRPSALLICFLLLLVSAVAWRRGAYFSGGLDIVVVTKAALTALAVAIAWAMPRQRSVWQRFRAAPLIWLGAYLVDTVIGGFVGGTGLPSAILAFRVLLMAVAVVLLIVSHPWQRVLSALTSAMVLLAGVGSVTGVSSLAETGRLYGGIPPLNANEICLLVSVPAALLFWKCVHDQASRVEYVVLAMLLGVVWLTGARTGLAALIVAMVVITLLSRRLATPIAVVLAASIPVILWITFFTPLVSDFASRGDPSNITTLNSRTVAWEAAIDYAGTPVERIFGYGLALKEIPVSAAYRTSQILDSTWVSALLQAGVLGTAILVLFVITILSRALRLPRPRAELVFAVVCLLAMVSILESGLFDSTSAFATFFTMAMLSHYVGETQAVDPAVGVKPSPLATRSIDPGPR